MFHATAINHERYTAAYNNADYQAITAMFDEHMPADDSLVAALLLQDACFEHTEHGNRRLGINEVELKSLILHYIDYMPWVDCINAVNAYLARFNA